MGTGETEIINPVGRLREAIDGVVAELAPQLELKGRPTLERPPKPELGDFSTNAAMLLAPVLSTAPREVAERLAAELGVRLGSSVRSVEVAGPGFVNFFMTEGWYREAVFSLVSLGDRIGAGGESDLETILIEFVSANPTGPLTVASGRGAAFGDSLARMLELLGHSVVREYYLNDGGTQVSRFAGSIAAAIKDTEAPEGGYEGAYVADLANELEAQGVDPDDLETLQRLAVEAMRTRIEASLERFRVHFDVWSSERDLLESGAMTAAIEELRSAGHVYESDGAVWMRTSQLGDDKDRVLVRADGEPTYFATDIAYHRDKLGRADHLIHPLGADHHGYVPRIRGAIEALGADPERYDAPLLQFMHVVEAGERASMSKRRGEFVTLDELVDEVGVDAARFFLVQRSSDSTLDLDLDLAKRQSQDNPVYYIQYAHARLASILRKAGSGAGLVPSEAAARAAVEQQAERDLIKRLLELPAEVEAAAAGRAPHRLCAYATATAADFHAFYRDCQVIGAPEPGLEEARLVLCVAAKRTLARALDLLGVEAPERDVARVWLAPGRQWGAMRRSAVADLRQHRRRPGRKDTRHARRTAGEANERAPRRLGAQVLSEQAGEAAEVAGREEVVVAPRVPEEAADAPLIAVGDDRAERPRQQALLAGLAFHEEPASKRALSRPTEFGDPERDVVVVVFRHQATGDTDLVQDAEGVACIRMQGERVEAVVDSRYVVELADEPRHRHSVKWCQKEPGCDHLGAWIAGADDAR